MPTDRLLGADHHALVPRTGPARRLHRAPERSLFRQHVLNEDTYTAALSHIISRDFFPHLPHLRATNNYLTALRDNDPDLLSASIRTLATLANQDDRGRRAADDIDAESIRRDITATPYISVPGARDMRTPVGARGWDTPQQSTRRRRNSSDFDSLEGDRPSRASSSKRQRRPPVRADLSLDTFQRNFTSEDNASFAQIVQEDNRVKREERFGWAFEAEKAAETRRIEGETKRKAILDAATSGQWRVNGEGRRLIGGLAEGGKEKAEGEAWKNVKLIGAAPLSETGDTSQALVPAPSSQALVLSDQPTRLPTEIPLPPKHPLAEALTDAGLPTTALISAKDGQIVPHREVATGSDARATGEEGQALENRVMSEGDKETVSLGGSGVDLWKYKVRNNLMYPADADTDPYAKPPSIHTLPINGPRPSIAHANTRIPEEDTGGMGTRAGSTRASSPSRSVVSAAVRGGPREAMPTVNNYPLVATDPSPSPQDMPSLLTWGSLLATPRALDGNNDPLDSTPSFRLPETKRRDELGRKLADKAGRDIKERARGFARPTSGIGGNRGKGDMGPPGTPRRQAGNLTPAAKRLLDRTVGRTPVVGSRTSSNDWAGKSSTKSTGWTPTPKKR
ncbi:hypothetical protein I350_04940 [Cryptococcus amylolentus CBS 6273]|uniref:Protein DGCR14 n=1 Tax=Cryptococcus amylolentus CBS 6273 TaxID=1296118 RepID=A0A1E3JYJ0_9TREE|nr:hypothetical protein I350_04940 [Cryptococcus amylolentus CBS 6273]